jgi:hypothetical protein
MNYTVSVHKSHQHLLTNKSKTQFSIDCDTLVELTQRLDAAKLGERSFLQCVTIKSGQYVKPVDAKHVADGKIFAKVFECTEAVEGGGYEEAADANVPFKGSRTCFICDRKISKYVANKYHDVCRVCHQSKSNHDDI